MKEIFYPRTIQKLSTIMKKVFNREMLMLGILWEILFRRGKLILILFNY
jgi:hypothetical protein